MSSYVIVTDDAGTYSVELQETSRGYSTQEEAQMVADFINKEVFRKINMKGGGKLPDPRAEERKKANERISKGLKR